MVVLGIITLAFRLHERQGLIPVSLSECKHGRESVAAKALMYVLKQCFCKADCVVVTFQWDHVFIDQLLKLLHEVHGIL